MAKKNAPNTTKKEPQAYSGVGVVFLVLGLGLMIPEGTRASGIPFLVLGITFLALGQKKPN